MSRDVEFFKFEVTPWAYTDRDGEWRISVTANGQRYDYTQVVPRIPFNKSELEQYIRAALAAYEKAGEDA